MVFKMVNVRFQPHPRYVSPQRSRKVTEILMDDLEAIERMAANAGEEGVPSRMTEKEMAGIQLYFALYYHPKARDLFRDYGSPGLVKAYSRAQAAFGGPGR